MDSVISATEVMPDVQSRKDLRHIEITQVGIREVKHPILLQTSQGAVSSIADWELTVQLPAHEKGTHMSRFMALLDQYREIPMTQAAFKQMAQDMLPLLKAQKGKIKVSFPYFIRKEAPVSKVASLMNYDVVWTAHAEHKQIDLEVEVVVPVMSLCPCSKEISDYGAHNQRSHVTVMWVSEEPLELEKMIPIIEAQGSSELWALLKRPDEKFVTETSYDNPKFVEDLIRDVAIELKKIDTLKKYRIEVENFESIHNHSAYAVIES